MQPRSQGLFEKPWERGCGAFDIWLENALEILKMSRVFCFIFVTENKRYGPSSLRSKPGGEEKGVRFSLTLGELGPKLPAAAGGWRRRLGRPWRGTSASVVPSFPGELPYENGRGESSGIFVLTPKRYQKGRGSSKFKCQMPCSALGGTRTRDFNPQSVEPASPTFSHGLEHLLFCSLLPHLWIYSQEWSSSNFPCCLTRNITSHSMKNLAFHRLLRWKSSVVPIFTTTFLG